ncbi:STAS domain-containing protein [Saccharothrix violaceirubra]|uniref:Anti-anti-sigma factor n=1 Tax=Saccharothrix violaceirubra TaxID=413306 RepID=A0A7W7T365_9PSEU|nr:STAS domain-containing protein [Saccharothrix violaceirubra]MBB4965723.1 anti-anti-sigma factor [Saccharothrix violaceirubra]
MTTPVRFTADEDPEGRTVLAVHGEIDMSNAAEFDQALRAALERGRPLLVDLTATGYLDSAALAVLFEHASSLSLRIDRTLRTLLSICGLSDLVPVEVVARP